MSNRKERKAAEKQSNEAIAEKFNESENDKFLDELNEPVKKLNEDQFQEVKTETKKELEFERIDTGEIKFHRFVDSADGKEKGTPDFIGEWQGEIYHGLEVNGKPNPEYNEEAEEAKGNVHFLNGLVFKNLEGDKVLLPVNYFLRNEFLEKERPDGSKGLPKGKIYKISFEGYEVMDGGKKVARFRLFSAK